MFMFRVLLGTVSTIILVFIFMKILGEIVLDDENPNTIRSGRSGYTQGFSDCLVWKPGYKPEHLR